MRDWLGQPEPRLRQRELFVASAGGPLTLTIQCGRL
jgi:hypothetical protein